MGQKAMEQLQQELALLNSGIEPLEEKRSPSLNQMPLIIGADGVMVPIRPQEKTPKGKTLWREVARSHSDSTGISAQLHGQTVLELISSPNGGSFGRY